MCRTHYPSIGNCAVDGALVALNQVGRRQTVAIQKEHPLACRGPGAKVARRSSTWPTAREYLQRKAPGGEPGNGERGSGEIINDNNLSGAATWRKHIQTRHQQPLDPMSVV